MPPMRSRITIVVIALVLVAGVAAAWWFEGHSGPAAAQQATAAAPTAPSSATTASASAYRIRVTRDGHQLASFDLAALQALGMRTVKLQGGTETGPGLLDVLAHAGAGDYTTVTIIGSGERDSGRLVIARTQIGPDTVLDIAKRGTVKVAGPNIAYGDRVRDIREIQVR